MESSQKDAIAASMQAAIQDLEREHDALVMRAYRVNLAIEDILRAWQRLDLGPLPCSEEGKLNPSEKRLALPPVSELEEGAGMTERIRAILRANADTLVSPTEVRDLLEETGFSTSGRSNVMAEIHAVLKRLASKPATRIGRKENEKGVQYFYDAFQYELPPEENGA